MAVGYLDENEDSQPLRAEDIEKCQELGVCFESSNVIITENSEDDREIEQEEYEKYTDALNGEVVDMGDIESVKKATGLGEKRVEKIVQELSELMEKYGDVNDEENVNEEDVNEGIEIEGENNEIEINEEENGNQDEIGDAIEITENDPAKLVAEVLVNATSTKPNIPVPPFRLLKNV